MLDATPREMEIAQYRATGLSALDIAARLRVNIGEVYSTLALPHVKAMVVELRADMLRPMLDLARTELYRSVKYLADVRDDELSKTTDRVKSSQLLIQWYKDVDTQVEILPRLAALEASLSAQRTGERERDDDTLLETRALAGGPDVPAGLVADDEGI